jgi:hypothetical protein
MQNKINKYLAMSAEAQFPYPSYPEKDLVNAYHRLCEETLSKTSNTGLELVKHFHASIWRCNINGRPSPLDAWQNEDIMTKIIVNRLKYLKTENLSLNNLLTGLSVTKLAPKVSVFRPAMSKYLVQKYLSEYDNIFDPCAGFGGRMLGICCLGKKYIGQDINSITITESTQLKEFLNLNADLGIKDSLYDFGEYDCLFTCPPYGNKENWHQVIEELSADEWIAVCLQNYKCKRYLFVVDKTERYQQYVVEKLQNKSHFSSASELVILIDK